MELRKHFHLHASILLSCVIMTGAFSVQAQANASSSRLIKGESWSTVYYVSDTGERRPFLNESTYFTYHDSFDEVITVPDEELATYFIGNPIAPKAGSLVKIQSVPHVYVVDGTIEDPVLRWIISEEIARDSYGANWAKRVMDIPPTMWPVFSFGDDIAHASDIPVKPLLYGFWGLDGFISEEGLADVHDRFGTTVFQVASADPVYTVKTLLPLVDASDMKVMLRMSSGNAGLATDGSFSLEKWKEDIAMWKNSGVQMYIDNGTLVGHMLLDDILTFTGYDPTAAELDEMARYSEEVMPGLMTFVRNRATTMPVPADGTYEYLDAVVNQYLARNGDVGEYAASESVAADALNVGVINGLNIADGGDGSSGQPGWREGFYAMSAEEIERYSDALLSIPTLNFFLMWEYGQEPLSDGTIGSDYFDQSEFEETVSLLSNTLHYSFYAQY